MRTPSSIAGRLFDGTGSTADAVTLRGGRRNQASDRLSEVDLHRPPPPQSREPAIAPLRRTQHACYEALKIALEEGQVFAALTGPKGVGKTTVLEAVLADCRGRALRCIRISDPEKVPAALAAQIEQVAYAEAAKPENLERHIVLAVDDAHLASEDLMRCLARLASMREPGRRVPQLLLVGRPELWSRLTAKEYEPLSRRLAIRAALPAGEDSADPWASVEAEVSQTMLQSRIASDDRPTSQGDLAWLDAHSAKPDAAPELMHDETSSPSSMFALFPDAPGAQRSAARETRRRLLMPLVSLFVGLAAFAFALSFYDWPDLLSDLPWSPSQSPSSAFVMPRSLQSQSFGLPQPPPATPSVPTMPPPQIAAPLPSPAQPAAPGPAPIEASPAKSASTPPPASLPAPEPVAPVTQPAQPTPRPAANPHTEASEPVPAAAPRPAVTEPEPRPLAAAAPAASVASISPSLIDLLLRRGDEQIAIGDVSAARLLFERAADAGSGLGALQLARTYDPTFLPRAVEGNLADRAKAVGWYQRAVLLGNNDGAARLQALKEGR